MGKKPILIAWFASSIVLGCSHAPLDGGNPTVPLIHRAAAPACSPSRAPINCSGPDAGFGPPVTCNGDIQCSNGANGRCAGNSHDGCNCSYDTCVSDGDCPLNQLCDCRNRWRYGDNGPNTCIASNCRVDADCGAHGYCSPSFDPGCGAFFGVTGWFCHTAKDSCVNDSECVGVVDGGFGPPFCGFRPEVGRWVCSATQCAG